MHCLLKAAWDLHDDYPVGRYVIMPDHMHLFIGENDTSFVSLPNWVAKWKSYVTRRWKRCSDRPIWQRSFWDRQLLGAAAYESKWIYVQWNPVRHRLVDHPDDWPFQGAKVILRW
jgi:putative transposase